MSNEKVAIIGGGVSGVTSALLLQDAYAVTIFERERELLLKLLKTGNGRANIYNRGIKLSAYNDGSFMAKHYAKIEPTLDELFAALNILTYTDEAGRVYPYSRSARALKNVLEAKLKVNIKTNTNISNIQEKSSGYLVNDEHFDYVILATGSSAGLFKKSIANDNETLLLSSALTYTKFTPVIKTIRVKENLHAVKHERVDAVLSLWRGNDKIVSDRGEILFKEDGLSGIVSFVISSYLEWAVEKGNNLSVAIDFMPQYSAEELTKLLTKNNDLTYIFAPRIAALLQTKQFAKQVQRIKDFRLTPIAGNYPENTQAMHGGIMTAQIDDTFNVKKAPRLFVLGELLDVDGICGGYNLAFAFYSAVSASRALLDKLSKLQ